MKLTALLLLLAVGTIPVATLQDTAPRKRAAVPGDDDRLLRAEVPVPSTQDILDGLKNTIERVRVAEETKRTLSLGGARNQLPQLPSAKDIEQPPNLGTMPSKDSAESACRVILGNLLKDPQSLVLEMAREPVRAAYYSHTRNAVLYAWLWPTRVNSRVELGGYGGREGHDFYFVDGLPVALIIDRDVPKPLGARMGNTQTAEYLLTQAASHLTYEFNGGGLTAEQAGLTTKK